MSLSDSQIQSLGRDGLQRAAAGDFAGAEASFSRIVEAQPNSGQALHLLGQVRLKLGRFAEAREPLERAARFLPRDPAAQINLAGCLTKLGEFGGALGALERAALLKPNDAIIAHNMGRALEALGRTEEAERTYDRALSFDHRLVPSLSARAALLAARGEWAGALADLDTALVGRPDDAHLKLRRGNLLLRQGDWWRGLADHEARLDVGGEIYAPDLPRWRGEPLEGPLLLYPEQADIGCDAAMRDALMLARGVDATVECDERVAAFVRAPTMRRGASLEGFVAAAPLRSLPYLLGWTLDSLPPPPLPRREPTNAGPIGWFCTAPPPEAGIERDPDKVATCRLVVGDDSWPAHIAANLGLPTLILVKPGANWLWGPNLGISPWYESVELFREDDGEGLAARLAGC